MMTPILISSKIYINYLKINMDPSGIYNIGENINKSEVKSLPKEIKVNICKLIDNVYDSIFQSKHFKILYNKLRKMDLISEIYYKKIMKFVKGACNKQIILLHSNDINVLSQLFEKRNTVKINVDIKFYEESITALNLTSVPSDTMLQNMLITFDINNVEFYNLSRRDKFNFIKMTLKHTVKQLYIDLENSRSYDHNFIKFVKKYDTYLIKPIDEIQEHLLKLYKSHACFQYIIENLLTDFNYYDRVSDHEFTIYYKKSEIKVNFESENSLDYNLEYRHEEHLFTHTFYNFDNVKYYINFYDTRYYC